MHTFLQYIAVISSRYCNKKNRVQLQALLAAARIKAVGGKNEDQLLMPVTCTADDLIDTSTVEVNM